MGLRPSIRRPPQKLPPIHPRFPVERGRRGPSSGDPGDCLTHAPSLSIRCFPVTRRSMWLRQYSARHTPPLAALCPTAWTQCVSVLQSHCLTLMRTYRTRTCPTISCTLSRASTSVTRWSCGAGASGLVLALRSGLPLRQLEHADATDGFVVALPQSPARGAVPRHSQETTQPAPSTPSHTQRETTPRLSQRTTQPMEWTPTPSKEEGPPAKRRRDTAKRIRNGGSRQL